VTNRELLDLIGVYRARFDKQKASQHIPPNTCPLIDEIIDDLDQDGGDMEEIMEVIRDSNECLRELGRNWYELARDFIDDLEMTVKIRENGLDS